MTQRNSRPRRTQHTPFSLMLIGIAIGIFICLMLYGLDDYEPVSLPIEEGASLTLVALDVGQGDATLVMTDNYTMLIDCGERGGEALMDSYLKELGVTRIDAFVITHPHSDHMGIASHIIDKYEIGEILVTSMTDDLIPTTSLFLNFLDSAEKSSALTRTLALGEVIDLGAGATAEVIGPVRDNYKDLNDISAVMIVRLGDASFLLTGDAGTDSERDILESGRLKDCDILFAGHHGSRTSTTKPFLAAVSPRAAAISLGADNRYGHPHPEMIKRLNDADIEIFRTDVDGSIYITTDGSAIEITTQNRQISLAA